MDGKGKYNYSNGCEYEGDFLNGERHGKGAFYWPTGTYYKGDWQKDKKHGFGI